MKPRVLVVDACASWGGALTSLEALLPQLGDAGFDVAVMTATPAPALAAAPLSSSRGSHGAPWLWGEARRAVELARAFRRWRPDVVLANNDAGVNAAVYAAAAASKVPVAQYVRAVPTAGRLRGKLLARAACVFTVGAGTTRAVRLVRPDALEIDEGLSPAQWPTRRAGDAHALLWAATTAPWKGLTLAFTAYARSGVRRPLRVCHLGRLDAPAPRGVELHAAPRPASLDRLRAQSLAFVHTSLIPEPFGRAVLEAMAAGVAPIVPDEGTPARLVRHGVDGLHYQARDAGSLARALRTVDASPALARLLGDAAARRASGFTAARAFAPVVGALLALVDRRAGAEQPMFQRGTQALVRFVKG